MITNASLPRWIDLALLAAVTVLAFVFFMPWQGSQPIGRQPQDDQVLRVACSQELVPDPTRRIFPMPPQNQFILSLWEPLMECDPETGEPQPAAAESWNWSENRQVLTIRLRSDARWSNGEPVTAQDFVRSWRSLLRRNASLAQVLFPIKNAELYHRSDNPEAVPLGLEALDPLTLRLELAGTNAAFVASLADPLLSPMHPTSGGVLAARSYRTEPKKLITNGPFRLAGYSTEGPRLLASEHYHGRARVRLAGIQFVQAESLSLAPLLLAAGRADLLSPVSPDEPHPLAASHQLVRHSEPTLALSLWEFNLSRPPLRDARVRRALSLALDRAAAIPAKEANHLVPARAWMPDLPGWRGQILIQEDAAMARRLLAEAGYPGGVGLPVLELLLPIAMKGNPHPDAWCERWFHELGVRTRVTYEARADFSRRVAATDYDLAYQTLIATVPDAGDLLNYFTWPQDAQGTRWVDPELRAKLSQAEAKHGAERLALLQRAEQRVIAEMGVIPLMFYRRESLLSAEVRGWYPDPLARQSLKRLWLESAPVRAINTESQP
ncbi:MAG: peptide ABC transporter substrate-binding protein [Opitutaceae bacterium]|jgi:oligopeptide transport system substrate-binding protein|nr:peptide ABC transporter substrate-binding protein [Opitutaceae bacterium]